MQNVVFPSTEDFIYKEVSLFGEDCVLIYPKAFPKWNDQNKIFRSSLWRKSDNKLISAGYKKFTNYGEQPEFEPFDINRTDIEFIQKIDGSLLISSKFNSNLILRTRGTVDASFLANGSEIELLKQKYPKAFDNSYINSEKYTVLFEWTTPGNVIVLRETDEPTLWLIGIVKHEDYSYESQSELDKLAVEWNVNRPKRYAFNSFEEMQSAVSAFEGCEGVVSYSNNGQILKKFKSLRYCHLHKIKSNLNTDEAVIDLFLSSSQPSYNDFKKDICEKFDWEIWNQIQSIVSKIYDAKKEVDAITNHMNSFVERMKKLSSRKEQAEQIIASYAVTNRASMLFKILDGKTLGIEDLKKLYFQVMKYN